MLIAQGDRFASWVNGYQVVNWQDTRKPSDNPREGRRLEAGHLSLQGHDQTTDLDFRSVDVHEFLTSESRDESVNRYNPGNDRSRRNAERRSHWQGFAMVVRRNRGIDFRRGTDLDSDAQATRGHSVD